MLKQIAKNPTTTSKTNQTPFAQFTDALSTILSVAKSSLPSKATKKKSRKK